jgi:hypothetical protein
MSGFGQSGSGFGSRGEGAGMSANGGFGAQPQSGGFGSGSGFPQEQPHTDPFGQANPFDGFGSVPAGPTGDGLLTTPPGRSAHPPIVLLILACVAPVVSVVFLLPWANPSALWGSIGWLFSVGGGVGLLAAFTVIDIKRRTSTWYYTNETLLKVLRITALVLVLVFCALHALQIADVVSRLPIFAGV